MVASSFPLHRLPARPMEIVLQSFAFCNTIEYSLLSKKAKNLVTSSGLLFQAKLSEIDVSNQLKIDIEVLGRPFDYVLSPGYSSSRLEVQTQHTQWYLTSYSVKDFIDHLMVITNTKHVELIRFHCPGRLFYGQFLESYLSEFSYREVVFETGGITVSAEPLTFLIPFLQGEQLDLLVTLFDTFYTQCVLARNWGQMNGGSFNRLNQLLLNNSAHIRIQQAMLSNLDMNIFLKSWTNGSNPRLKHGHVCFPVHRDFDLNIILKEIEYQPVSSDELDRRGELTFLAHISIRKPDGTIALIKFSRAQFEMNVIGY